MFEDSVLENRIAHKRGWTTIASFALECVGITALVLLPLIYTEALPNLNILTRVQAPPAPAPPPHVDIIGTVHETSRNQSEFVDNVLILPPKIPDGIHRVNDNRTPLEAAPQGDWVGIKGATPGGSGNAFLTSLLRPKSGTPVIASPSPRAIRVSTIDEGQIVRRIQPTYPPIAIRTHVQGPVILEALIDREGRIENLKLVSGHPLLVSPAMDAVKQWRYRPYLLNGSPVEVQTTITVNFHLAN